MAQRNINTTALRKLLVICKCLWLVYKLAHFFLTFMRLCFAQIAGHVFKSEYVDFVFKASMGFITAGHVFIPIVQGRIHVRMYYSKIIA